jgi:hypothetical protein
MRETPLIAGFSRRLSFLTPREQSTGKLNSTTDYVAYYQFATSSGLEYSGKQSGYVKKPREGVRIPVRYLPAVPGINRGLADTSYWVALLYAVGAMLGFGLGITWIRKPPVIAYLWLWLAGALAAGPAVYLFINLPAFVPALDT